MTSTRMTAMRWSDFCASCLAKLLRGSARMRRNEVLNEAEIAEGPVLTCQAEPTSAEVEVDY
jgi:ring-1,2-phenylacetyl-CoA epoxidase subunit PaaE